MFTHLSYANQANSHTTRIGNTTFTIIEMENGFGKQRIIQAIRNSWKHFNSIFEYSPEHITIIEDSSAPMGGGAKEDFVFHIYTMEDIPIEVAPLIESMLGWSPQDSTANYILNEYSDFDDPIQAYVDDVVIHELAHAYLGYGKTKVNGVELDNWFALGLGIVYDRLIWNKLNNGKKSPIFFNTVQIWKNKYSRNQNIDQKLINPDISNDQRGGLVSRMQTYGHGKSYVFLRKLREQITPIVFDKIVNKFITKAPQPTISYDNFLLDIPAEYDDIIKNLEEEFQVR